MSGLGQRLRDTYTTGAPLGYVPGVGRGAIGFTTRSDIGPARPAAQAEGLVGAAGFLPPAGRGRGVPLGDGGPGAGRGGPGAGRGSGTAGLGGFGREKDENEDYGDYSETNYDEFSGYSSRGLFQDTPYDKDDEEADSVYDAIDARMDGRRKRRREEKMLEELQKQRQQRPKISDQFADLKADLKAMSDADWEQIPDIGDYSLKYKTNTALQRRHEMFAPVPDHVLANTANGSSNMNGTVTPAGTGLETPGISSSMSGLAEARGAVLSLKLDKMSDSVAGQTVVDPKGYLTDLNSLKVTSDAEIGDIKKARLLLRSVTMTNPKHGPGWIAAARLEEVAGKIVQARKIIAQGCECCPTQEDVWLEAARLQNPENAKTILAKAVRHVPTSEKVWLQAAQLEQEDELKKLVMRRALEFIPNSVKIWKALIELEDIDGARILLGRAVECVPHSVDLWLALARLETYENAKRTLNKARTAIPTEPSIWITAAKLEEAQGKDSDAIDRIIQVALKSLKKHQVVINRDMWLKEAEACEVAEAPLTCGAIVRACLDLGVEPEDRKRTWIDDAENSMAHGALLTAKNIFAYALKVFPAKKSIWLRAVALEKQINPGKNIEAVEQLLQQAVTHCPNAEILWLMAAKEVWNNGSVDSARTILRQAFSANPNSESIWLAAVKLEWENDEIELARALLAKARAQAPSPHVWMKSILLEREQADQPQLEEALLMEAVQKYPEFAKLHMMAGQFYEFQDPPKYEDAKKMYRAGLQHCPKSIPLWILSSRLEEKINGVTKARSVLEMARLKNPKNDMLWLEASRLEARWNNPKGQEMLMAKALQECPESGVLLAESIDIAPRAQQKRASFTALKKKDNDPAVCLSVAKLFWQERKYSKARKWLERTVELDGDFGDGWAHYYLFEIQHANDKVDADKIVERCIKADPHHGELWTLRRCKVDLMSPSPSSQFDWLLGLTLATEFYSILLFRPFMGVAVAKSKTSKYNRNAIRGCTRQLNMKETPKGSPKLRRPSTLPYLFAAIAAPTQESRKSNPQFTPVKPEPVSDEDMSSVSRVRSDSALNDIRKRLGSTTSIRTDADNESRRLDSISSIVHPMTKRHSSFQLGVVRPQFGLHQRRQDGFFDIFGIWGVAMVMSFVSAAIALLNQAYIQVFPSAYVNWLMDKKQYDSGDFWLTPDPDPLQKIVSPIVLIAFAMCYIVLTAMMTVFRQRLVQRINTASTRRMNARARNIPYKKGAPHMSSTSSSSEPLSAAPLPELSPTQLARLLIPVIFSPGNAAKRSVTIANAPDPATASIQKLKPERRRSRVRTRSIPVSAIYAEFIKPDGVYHAYYDALYDMRPTS
ncbi:hypothetical protein Poli38472_011381 [Pythium oligandrum]|uniref:PRP1 splicing factor N-terminal domain-containing protein n=1 Tax=Pythium oligandrum TaxID=41045 RepID=A0A8K1FJ36_PYTOL|nr:hypothetical protein Poli38472_011381 [Pythium oligandrum]|eukprot:TMW64501.1 hypothetical protein Poli38472_011381 [Pythium oligandrum]